MIIIVSGTPGTGKTYLAKRIAKEKRIKYLDVNKFIENNSLAVGFDKKRDSKIIDEKKLSEKFEGYLKTEKKLVIDSHLSHFISPEYVDKCIITKCNVEKLKKRLEKRGYSKEKVRENLDAEIFDVCLIEATEQGHDPIIIFSDKEIDINSLF